MASSLSLSRYIRAETRFNVGSLKSIVQTRFLKLPPGPQDIPPTAELFVSGLDRNKSSKDLRNMFAQFGELLEASIVTNTQTGRPRGVGFVKYAKIEEAVKAKEAMDGKFLDGRVIFADYSKYENTDSTSSS